MTVSVVIPAYNCSGYLENAVDCILASGLEALEILIINDGSTDDTEETALLLQDVYRNLRVISQPNRGVSEARNRGIREAAGDYLFFMDADDSLVPGSMADVNKILNAEHPDQLLFGILFDYYRHGILYRSDALSYPKHGIMTSEEWAAEFESLFLHNMLSPVWNKLIHRDLILRNQLWFREDMIEMEDYLFSAQCMLSSDRIYLLDKAVYRYRQAEDERGTFNRLWRIRSLSEYMDPFYEAAEKLDARFAAADLPCQAGKVSDMIYSSLFHEKLRFASPKQIRLAAEDMLAGKRSDVIARRDPKLYQNLKDRKYTQVWSQRALSRTRHQLAVLVKYRRSLREHE